MNETREGFELENPDFESKWHFALFSFLVQKLIRGFIFFAAAAVKLHIFFMLNLTIAYNFHAKRPLL